jgi:leucyl aminopeptidase (aminopeptidase T)
MNWPEKDAIAHGVADMLQVNMGLRPGEMLLVATDVPGTAEWKSGAPAGLKMMLTRAMLARMVADIATEGFPKCDVTLLPFRSTGGHGAEPDDSVAAELQATDVVIALTTYSLSHTTARERATKAGVRLASMPGFETQMFEAGGPMAVDYGQIAEDCQKMAELLTAANDVRVRTEYGTDLAFSIKGRPGQVDDGLYGAEPGLWGNLPAGETYAVPVEGTGRGRLVVPAGWYPGLEEQLTFRFEDGQVVELTGGGAVGNRFRDLLRLGSDDPVCERRRNLAELGIGTNPNARRPDNVLEAEKIKGTVHIAIGDNFHMGGEVESDTHEDFVQPEPDLLLDGRPVIVRGEWRM